MTGHTGFKGGWLALWLAKLGAEVHGFALAPPTTPSFCDTCGVEGVIASSTRGDIGDRLALAQALSLARPEIVFHLSAQPLVRASYVDPLETYRVNVMGTLQVLEAIRHTPGISAVVNVTTDKCYENLEWVWPYRETERLGGFDPYSSSKACAELVSAAYRRSYLEAAGVHLATARAGNVIGGGDWAPDRLVPDVLRAADVGRPVPVRSPTALRPWQHVLDPLSGYLTLAERLVTGGAAYADAWNFGPAEDGRPVEWLVDRICAQLPGASWVRDGVPGPQEAHTLRLDNSKSRALLDWRPRWNLTNAIDRTLAWHCAWRGSADMLALTRDQIDEYEASPCL